MADLRIRSLRGYRRIGDEVIQQARRGEIPWRDTMAAAGALKSLSEILLAERELSSTEAGDSEVSEHVLGEDGGNARFMGGVKAKRPVVKRVTVKTGTDKRGNPIDERQEMVEGGDDVGQDAEDDNIIEGDDF